MIGEIQLIHGIEIKNLRPNMLYKAYICNKDGHIERKKTMPSQSFSFHLHMYQESVIFRKD